MGRRRKVRGANSEFGLIGVQLVVHDGRLFPAGDHSRVIFYYMRTHTRVCSRVCICVSPSRVIKIHRFVFFPSEKLTLQYVSFLIENNPIRIHSKVYWFMPAVGRRIVY